MPIDKITPRQLDADSDGKLISKTSMLDALNLYMGEDDNGNKGVLKNIKGNTSIATSVDFPSNHRVIGSATDVRTGICYLFVFSEDPSYHSIWAYDPEGKLANDGVEIITLIYRSKQFNFDSQGFVKGDVVHINNQTFTDRGPEFEKDAVLYFTDNRNEPRKLNVYRAYQAENNFQIHGDDIYAEADFITACPKTPLDPITFEFTRDEDRSVSNFRSEPGFQFAYQNVYSDGVDSAISCYSDIAFPPTIINQGANDVDHSLFNKCILTIPAQGPEISKIKIIARRGNSNDFFVIDEVESIANEPTIYEFFNDRVTRGVSSNESKKQFDNLPRRAKAQAVSSNRLMYGNYIDGYDNVQTTCTATIQYADRPNDFIDLNIGFKPAITRNENSSNKSTGFQLDFTEVQDSFSAGDTINFSITIAPEKNWHLYYYEGGSYHGTKFLGALEQVAPDAAYDGVNLNPDVYQTDTATGASFRANNDDPVFGSGDGIQGAIGSTLKWKTVAGNFADDEVNCNFGTSAGNPLILKGAPITFVASFEVVEDFSQGGRELVRDAITAIIAYKWQDALESNPSLNNTALNDAQLQNNVLDSLGVEILQRKHSSEVNIDLKLKNKQLIKQARINEPDDDTDPLASLIVAVKKEGSDVDFSVEPGENRIPIGYFIVDKANVVFDLEYSEEPNAPLLMNFLACVREINDVSVETCLHSPPSGSSNNLSWIVLKKEAVLSEGFTLGDFVSGINSTLEYSLTTPFDGGELNEGEDPNGPRHNYLRQIGYLKFSPENGLTDTFFQNRTNNNGTYLPSASKFSLLDGEGGPCGGRQKGVFNGDANPDLSPYDEALIYNQGSVTVNADPNGIQNVSFYASTVFYGGTIKFSYNEDGDIELGVILPELGLEGDFAENDEDQGVLTGAVGTIDFKRLHSFAELASVFFYVNEVNVQDRSFKSSADHDFGIIYYDERGRHGFVNPLTTVYVPGYSSTERDGPPGSVSIDLTLHHTPPSWAHKYKIAYSKNTTMKEFVQYSSGGAFAQLIQNQGVSESNQNIYVSLNYLQESNISYASAFGARGIDGGLSIYKFAEGDKLRVISFDEGGSRKYVFNYEFDVVDYRLLSDGEDNPLSEEPSKNQQGAFVVLRNNPFAFGFDYTSVAAGSDKWGDNCIFEIYSPYQMADEEDRIYYEIGETGDVAFSDDSDGYNGPLTHVPSTISLTKGDVWFRKVPVNLREFNGGVFEDLIYDDDEVLPDPTPNFKSVYLETMSANDTIKSNSHSIGRPNVYSELAGQVIRESSITYSDSTDPSSKKSNFSSFNINNLNFKDLSENYGDINHMSSFGEYLVVLQRNKISMVPLNRNILSDASGNQNIISSREILGDPVFINQDDGSSSPESVIKVDSKLYFADSNSYQVFKMDKSGGGVITISDNGVASLIRKEIKQKESEDGRVMLVGGYDPVKEEYLLTIISVPQISLSEPAEIVIQELVTETPPQPPAEEDDEIVITDNNGDGIISFEEVIEQSGFDPGLILEEGEEVITDLNNDGNIDINDFITGLVANGQDPIQILSAYIQNTDDAASFTDGLINDLITGGIIQPNDLSVASSTGGDNFVDPETASISELVDVIVAKIGQFSDESPENTLTVGDLKDILEATRIEAQSWTLNAAINQVLSDLDGNGLVATPDLLLFLGTIDSNLSNLDNSAPLIFPNAS
jgi:hypothetical protein